MIKFKYISKEEMFLIDTTVYWFEFLDHKGVAFDEIGASVKGKRSYKSIFEKPSDYIMINKEGYEYKTNDEDVLNAITAINEQCKAIVKLEWLVKYFRGCLEPPLNKVFGEIYVTTIKGGFSVEQLENTRNDVLKDISYADHSNMIYNIGRFNMFFKLLIDNFGA